MNSEKYTTVAVSRECLERLRFAAGGMPVATFLNKLSIELTKGRTPMSGTGLLASPVTLESVKRDTGSLVTVMSAIAEKLLGSDYHFMPGSDYYKAWYPEPDAKKAEKVERQPSMLDGATEVVPG